MADDLKIGTLIGEKYRIDAYIGAGGMGTVYEATHLALHRKVAIKVLKHVEIGDGKSLIRFHREAKTAGVIRHENVCEVTDFAVDKNGRAFLVMPLLSGISFSDLLRREGPLNGNRIIDICCQTLSALQAAHEKNIIHRDLKPANLFVTRLGERHDFVKLLDFGISKYLDGDAATKLTRTGLIPGTPLYMSPEQAEGQRDLDHRTDLYSLGVILYETFTGKLPFNGDSYNEIMFSIVTKPFKFPRALNPHLPVCIENVILKAMARDPNLRFKSAAEMRRALMQLPKEALDASFGPSNGVGGIVPSTKTEGDLPMPQTSAEISALSVERQNKNQGLKKKMTSFSILVLAVINLIVIFLGILGYYLSETG